MHLWPNTMATLLLDRRADVGAKNNGGQMALVHAAHGGHKATTALLLDRGADAGE